MKKTIYFLAAGILFILAAVVLTGITGEAMGSQPSSAVSRTLEPVIVHGADLSGFDQAPVDNLFAFAFDGAAWQAIPIQIDEVDASGTYTVENGLLDGNDEVVLMAMDLGVQAPASEWISDPASQVHPRFELAVTNPLAPGEQGWAYLYRSETLAPPPADYVDWDGITSRYTAGAYVLGFVPGAHAGIDRLELNGSGVDVLDRSKLRINVDCYVFGIPINQTLTEEDLAGMLDPAPDIDGPVRAGGGTVDGSSWAYHAMNTTHAAFDIGGFAPPPPCESIVVHWVRLSNDWLDPVVSGMAPAVYYDANTPAGVAVDGDPDSILPSPFADWRQVSGGRGSVVNVAEVSLGGGALSNYYLDNGSIDPGDTGDQQSFGDAGARVDDPAGVVAFEMRMYVLGADQPNVGETYASYGAQPLLVTAVGQDYFPPEVSWWIFMPVVTNNVER